MQFGAFPSLSRCSKYSNTYYLFAVKYRVQFVVILDPNHLSDTKFPDSFKFVFTPPICKITFDTY